jgi:glutaminyl-peptide cyclotransferase
MHTAAISLYCSVMLASFSVRIFASIGAALISSAVFAQTCPQPKTMTFEVESQIRRDVLGFTQGLELRGDKLFESTGAIAGDTRLTTIDPKTGRVMVIASFGKRFFGEGLTILNDQIFQLSWQEKSVFVYDVNGRLVRRMQNARDGWGLTNDGTNLIFTDGGDRLYYVNPADFRILGSVAVRIGDSPLPALNELEMVDGKIYANVFLSWDIVRIDPRNGCVEAIARLDGLQERMTPDERRHIASNNNFVLNGIAYDAARRLFYVTGKNWMSIFTGRFADQR